MRRSCLLAALLLAASVARLIAAEPDAPLPDGLYAEFTTPHGPVIVRLHYRQVPLTVTSFVGLAEGTLAPRDGHPFYTGLTWYRVVPGFVIQSGNPGLKDTGDVPIPYSFPDEFVPGLRHAEIGTLSMANAGPDTNGCEFFLTLADDTRLNYLYTVFGETVRGREILPQIKPDEPFTIKILRVGAEARAFRANPEAFQALLAKARHYHGPAEPGPNAFFDDPAGLIPRDPPRARYFNFKLANFAQATGVRIIGRLFPHSPPAAEDAVPGAYMHALAAKLGVDRRGALVAYFADEKDWRIWLSDEAADTFLGHPATPADLATEGPLHKLKTAFIDAAVAEGDAAYAHTQKESPPDRPPPPAQQLKLQVDALLDHLILKLEPKTK
ncbi:MAG TPA: peptidylprolyl isomerase [Lacunisphaera sp.]|nr:peptidylprolyl isomerase [Lacunisphaera sp.]